MLVLSRKPQEVVVVGGLDGLPVTLTVTVLEVRGQTVRLGFEAEGDVPVNRLEVWERLQAGVGPISLAGGPAGPRA